MSEIIEMGTAILDSKIITEELYTRFINYIDASPKTIQTYTRAIRQFSKWLSFKGIN